MKLRFSKTFEKEFSKLSPKLKHKTRKTIDRFKGAPFHPLLRNHALKGPMAGRRAISVTGDIRIVFEEYDGYVVVLFLDIGRHGRVYGEG